MGGWWPGPGDRSGRENTRTDREQLQVARIWLRAKGHQVSDRDLIKAGLMQTYLDNAGH